MALFSKKPKTSAQKAQQAKMRILARLLGCGYLIYIVVSSFIMSPPDELDMSPTARYVIMVFFIVAAAVLLIASVREFFINKKAGYYDESFHKSDLGADDYIGSDEEADNGGEDESYGDGEEYEDDEDYDEDGEDYDGDGEDYGEDGEDYDEDGKPEA